MNRVSTTVAMSGFCRMMPISSSRSAASFENVSNSPAKNACGAPFNHYWFFAAGLTDVDTLIEVADTRTGRVLTYHNPQARPFPAVQDTDAFPTWP